VSQAARILQLIGTFLPLYGVVLTVIAGFSLKGRWRVGALLLIPLLTYVLCGQLGSFLGDNGNMLFVALFAVYIALLPIYYPVLLIVFGIKWIRYKQGEM